MRDAEKGDTNPQDAERSSIPPVQTIAQDDPAFIVKWAENDPDNPQNWSLAFKSWVTLQLSMLALAASVASSMISPANPVLAEYLHVSDTVIVLDVSLFVYDILPVQTE